MGALTWGDMEKLEVAGPWPGTEGGSMDPTRKMGHEVKEKPKEVEMEMEDDVPQEERVDIPSPNRKVIRVESEETLDHVRETLAISQEEAEEMGFVPSALGEPRRPIFWCDNRCSENAIRYLQIASLVVEEGGEGYRKEESRRSGPSKEFAKLARRWQRMKSDVRALCRKF